MTEFSMPARWYELATSNPTDDETALKTGLGLDETDLIDLRLRIGVIEARMNPNRTGGRSNLGKNIREKVIQEVLQYFGEFDNAPEDWARKAAKSLVAQEYRKRMTAYNKARQSEIESPETETPKAVKRPEPADSDGEVSPSPRLKRARPSGGPPPPSRRRLEHGRTVKDEHPRDASGAHRVRDDGYLTQPPPPEHNSELRSRALAPHDLSRAPYQRPGPFGDLRKPVFQQRSQELGGETEYGYGYGHAPGRSTGQGFGALGRLQAGRRAYGSDAPPRRVEAEDPFTGSTRLQETAYGSVEGSDSEMHDIRDWNIIDLERDAEQSFAVQPDARPKSQHQPTPKTLTLPDRSLTPEIRRTQLETRPTQSALGPASDADRVGSMSLEVMSLPADGSGDGTPLGTIPVGIAFSRGQLPFQTEQLTLIRLGEIFSAEDITYDADRYKLQIAKDPGSQRHPLNESWQLLRWLSDYANSGASQAWVYIRRKAASPSSRPTVEQQEPSKPTSNPIEAPRHQSDTETAGAALKTAPALTTGGRDIAMPGPGTPESTQVSPRLNLTLKLGADPLAKAGGQPRRGGIGRGEVVKHATSLVQSSEDASAKQSSSGPGRELRSSAKKASGATAASPLDSSQELNDQSTPPERTSPPATTKKPGKPGRATAAGKRRRKSKRCADDSDGSYRDSDDDDREGHGRGALPPWSNDSGSEDIDEGSHEPEDLKDPDYRGEGGEQEFEEWAQFQEGEDEEDEDDPEAAARDDEEAAENDEKKDSRLADLLEQRLYVEKCVQDAVERKKDNSIRIAAHLWGLDPRQLLGTAQEVALPKSWGLREGLLFWAYQLVGASEMFLQERDARGGGIFSDDMGLGKTLMLLLSMMLSNRHRINVMSVRRSRNSADASVRKLHHPKGGQTKDTKPCASQSQHAMPCCCLDANNIPGDFQVGMNVVLAPLSAMESWASTWTMMAYEEDGEDKNGKTLYRPCPAADPAKGGLRLAIHHEKVGPGYPHLSPLTAMEWVETMPAGDWSEHDERNKAATLQSDRSEPRPRQVIVGSPNPFHPHLGVDRPSFTSSRFVVVATYPKGLDVIAKRQVLLRTTAQYARNGKTVISNSRVQESAPNARYAGRVVIDEFHQTKRAGTNALTFARMMCERARAYGSRHRCFVWGASGTPHENGVKDLIGLMGAVADPKRWPVAAAMAEAVVVPDDDGSAVQPDTPSSFRALGIFADEKKRNDLTKIWEKSMSMVSKGRLEEAITGRDWEEVCEALSILVECMVIRRIPDTVWMDGNPINPVKADFLIGQLLCEPGTAERAMVHNREAAVEEKIKHDNAQKLREWRDAGSKGEEPKPRTFKGSDEAHCSQICATFSGLVAWAERQSPAEPKRYLTLTDDLKRWLNSPEQCPLFTNNKVRKDIEGNSCKLDMVFRILDRVDKTQRREDGEQRAAVIGTRFPACALFAYIALALRYGQDRVAMVSSAMPQEARFKTTTLYKEPGGLPENDPRFLVCTVGILRSGAQLQRASTVVLLEPHSMPGEELQFLKRIHRIGQRDDVCRAFVLRNDASPNEKRTVQRRTARRLGGKHAYAKELAPTDGSDANASAGHEPEAAPARRRGPDKYGKFVWNQKTKDFDFHEEQEESR